MIADALNEQEHDIAEDEQAAGSGGGRRLAHSGSLEEPE